MRFPTGTVAEIQGEGFANEEGCGSLYRCIVWLILCREKCHVFSAENDELHVGKISKWPPQFY